MGKRGRGEEGKKRRRIPGKWARINARIEIEIPALLHFPPPCYI